MKKICIIDSISHHTFHEMGNACLLIECLSITNEIVYFSGKSSCNSVKKILNNRDLTGVVFKRIPAIEGTKKIHTPLRYLLSALVNIMVLLILKKDVLVFYNYNNAFSLPIINIMSKVLKKRIAVLCHGEFEYFNKSIYQKHNLFWRFYYKVLEDFFTNRNLTMTESLIFFVLGDNIRKNMKDIVPNRIYKKIYFIDQSYIQRSFKQKERDGQQTIHFGMIGEARKGKNISDYISLVKLFSPEISNGRVFFSVIGSISTGREELKTVGIDIPGEKGWLSREDFNASIAALDYVLFFYNNDMYKFTASGPFFDAINFSKPIIALRNDYFEYMFKKYGDVGILVDSIDDMAVVIRDLLTGKAFPAFSFDKIQEELQPEKVALQLKCALEEAGML